MAGIAAGAGEGAAPKARIISVKVMGDDDDHTTVEGIAMGSCLSLSLRGKLTREKVSMTLSTTTSLSAENL